MKEHLSSVAIWLIATIAAIKKGGENMAMTLKALRVNAGLNQRTAANQIGVTPETLSSWERGSTFPNVPQIEKISLLYNVGYNDINFLQSDVGLNDKEL